jgi:diguanylate cyclase (GGDEF)-like protein
MVPTREGWSLRRAFARLLLFTAFLPALVFGVITVANQHIVDRAQVADRLDASARITAASIDDYLESRVAAVALLADLRAGGSPSWNADLSALHARHPDFVTVLVTDAQGQVTNAQPVGRVPPGVSLDVRDREYFRVPRTQGRSHVSNAFRGRGLGSDALVAVSAPLLDADGRFAGVVEGSIRVDTFAKRRGEAFRERGYEFLLVDNASQAVYATEGLGLEFMEQVADPRLLGPAGIPGHSTYEEGLLGGGRSGYVARAGMTGGWRLVLVAHEAPLLDSLAGRGLLLLGLLALVTIGVVAASWRQMRQLAHSTRELLQMLRGYALGGSLPADGLARLPVELKPVASAIDDLAGRLNEAYEGLNEALDKQRGLAESLRTVVATREREIRDRTEELRDAVAQLDRMSRTDALTGCLNYRGLLETMQSLREVPDGAKPELSVLALDIDHFKAYNDHYGHQKGDNALRRFAGAVRSVLYQPEDSFARSGGEEFVVLLPDTTLEQATAIAERVRESVCHAEIPHEAGAEGVLTVSIGVAHADAADGEDPEQLLRRADAALYRAKQAGRNRVST